MVPRLRLLANSRVSVVLNDKAEADLLLALSESLSDARYLIHSAALPCSIIDPC